MSDELSEAEIVRGLRSGDRGAWNALCLNYQNRLWRHIARLVGSDQVAVADVFQETMLSVAGAGRRLREDSKLWPWLAQIGHHQAAYYLRRESRRRTEPCDMEQSVPSRTGTPAAALLQGEAGDIVRGLLAEMNADYVTLLTAKYIDGLSVAEIVELVGGTSESVRSRLARARRDFRERYQRVTADCE